MKQFELTEEMCTMIVDALQGEINRLAEHNEIMQIFNSDKEIDYYVMKNSEQIGKLQTLLNYINS